MYMVRVDFENSKDDELDGRARASHAAETASSLYLARALVRAHDWILASY